MGKISRALIQFIFKEKKGEANWTLNQDSLQCKIQKKNYVEFSGEVMVKLNL